MMRLWMIARVVLIAVLGIIVAVPLYAIPATLSLPKGPRPGLKKLTIPEAAHHLRNTGKTGWSLIEAARVLVAERMQYSRRNAFATPAKAFERGYGYCHQTAHALADLLTQLGFKAAAVNAHRYYVIGKDM